MKQKIVMKIPMNDLKSRSKAMKTAVGLQGVISATLEGGNKEQLVVVGEGVNSVVLTTLLRKKMGFTELVSVAVVDEKKKEEETKPSSETAVLPLIGPTNTARKSHCIMCTKTPTRITVASCEALQMISKVEVA